MNDISSEKWLAMSDKALAKQIATFIKHHRIAKNKTQDEVAKAAAISRSTLSLLERGETVTIATLLQVVRVLDQLQIMDVFVVNETVSPLALAKLQKNKRQRARSNNNNLSSTLDW